MIFIVEDNDSIRETVRSYLEVSGYEVREFAKVEGVLESFRLAPPLLCILDVMLPDGNGFALAKEIKAGWPDTALLFLTARESESDRIMGLELGAEDYMVKPFSPRELVLRAKILLNRRNSVDGKTGRWTAEGHLLHIDEKGHAAFLDSEQLELTAVEWKILVYLARRPNVLASRGQILSECLQYIHDGSDRTVNTHMKNLRSKLGQTKWIETVRGFGYKFVGTPSEEDR
jgi:two-component system phosphate regulon response regulator PhoB